MMSDSLQTYKSYQSLLMVMAADELHGKLPEELEPLWQGMCAGFAGLAAIEALKPGGLQRFKNMIHSYDALQDSDDEAPDFKTITASISTDYTAYIAEIQTMVTNVVSLQKPHIMPEVFGGVKITQHEALSDYLDRFIPEELTKEGITLSLVKDLPSQCFTRGQLSEYFTELAKIVPPEYEHAIAFRLSLKIAMPENGYHAVSVIYDRSALSQHQWTVVDANAKNITPGSLDGMLEKLLYPAYVHEKGLLLFKPAILHRSDLASEAVLSVAQGPIIQKLHHQSLTDYADHSGWFQLAQDRGDIAVIKEFFSIAMSEFKSLSQAHLNSDAAKELTEQMIICVQALYEFDSDAKSHCPLLREALMMSIETSNKELFETLAQSGLVLDFYMRTKEGLRLSPLILAASLNQSEMIDRLLSCGANKRYSVGNAIVDDVKIKMTAYNFIHKVLLKSAPDSIHPSILEKINPNPVIMSVAHGAVIATPTTNTAASTEIYSPGALTFKTAMVPGTPASPSSLPLP